LEIFYIYNIIFPITQKPPERLNNVKDC